MLNQNYYRLYDNNDNFNRIIINGKIDKIVNIPNNINDIFNIDTSCGNIVHIPMVSIIYIEFLNIKKTINITDLHLYNNNVIFDDTLKIYSIKTTENMYYQDIIIDNNNEIIIIQIYKFKYMIDNISYGTFIIYQNNLQNLNSNNTIYYTRNKYNIINNIEDDKILINNNLINCK